MRDQIKKAMQELRKHQIMARMNHLCCSTCAGYDLAERLDKMDEAKAQKVIGFAYWHNQDEASYRDYGVLHLRYGGVDTQKYPDRDKATGWTTEKVGNLIVEVFKKHGVPVKWDGNPNQTILVADDEGLLEKQ